ncbi:hypothetical protein cand_031130 [Cryptosporidium andersoni]|uniref:Uncharacterized protein n=1 Tax=Cryptosporidium andersoni TaxID=117008 RepID=A0A1J4MQG8_9CRYT|nr:hypothetical protein cand_031130 [Cryptosporidium andersoni]
MRRDIQQLDPKSLMASLQELSQQYHRNIAEMNTILAEAKEKYRESLNLNNIRIQEAQDNMSKESQQLQSEFDEITKMYEKTLPEYNQEKIQIQSKYFKDKAMFDKDFQIIANDIATQISDINVKLMIAQTDKQTERLNELSSLRVELEKELSEKNSDYQANLARIDTIYKENLSEINKKISDLTSFVNTKTEELNTKRESIAQNYYNNVETYTKENNNAGEQYNLVCTNVSHNIRLRTQQYERAAENIRGAIEGAICMQRRQVVHSPYA